MRRFRVGVVLAYEPRDMPQLEARLSHGCRSIGPTVRTYERLCVRFALLRYPEPHKKSIFESELRNTSRRWPRLLARTSVCFRPLTLPCAYPRTEKKKGGGKKKEPYLTADSRVVSHHSTRTA